MSCNKVAGGGALVLHSCGKYGVSRVLEKNYIATQMSWGDRGVRSGLVRWSVSMLWAGFGVKVLGEVGLGLVYFQHIGYVDFSQ